MSLDGLHTQVRQNLDAAFWRGITLTKTHLGVMWCLKACWIIYYSRMTYATRVVFFPPIFPNMMVTELTGAVRVLMA